MTDSAILMEHETGASNASIKDLYLCFIVSGENYALDIAYIKEIISMCKITAVPETPDFVKGIINLRGDIAPVIDLRRRFGQNEKPYDDQNCIVVSDYENNLIGYVVDSVSGTTIISAEDISPPPSAKLSYGNQFVKNIGKSEEGVKLILDVDKLLYV